MSIKILQWNIWYKEKIENIISVLKQISPDIICLQELTINEEHNNFINTPKTISKSLNYNYNFAKAIQIKDAIQGNAIFSKYPITSNYNFFVQEPGKDPLDFSKQGRICVSSKIQIQSILLEIATTHLSYIHKFGQSESKLKEVEKLTNFLKNKKSNFIFTGDLNFSSNSPYLQMIQNHLINLGPKLTKPTWTTKPFSYKGFEEDKLRWRLDYILGTKDIKVRSSKIIQTPYSDHLPILIEIEH